MTGFSGLTGGAGWFWGLKTLFFCNFKLTNLKLKTLPSQSHKDTENRPED